MTCRRAQHEFDAVLDGRNAAEAWRHIQSCAECRRQFSNLDYLHKAAAKTPKPLPPSNLRERIARSIFSI